MSKVISESTQERVPLSRERVLRGAVSIADVGGIGSLTIRSLAQELGVKPMSVYHYVANKDEILDAIVDMVFSEIELPSMSDEWRSEMRRRAKSARAVLRRHPWAIGLMESRRTPGPASLRHRDAVIGTLRRAGFSVEMTAHAYALIDSYTYGFALQEAALPFNRPETVTDIAEPIAQQVSADDYPHLVEMANEHILQAGYDYSNEFEFGLSVILDALTQSLPSNDGDLAHAANKRTPA
jgi:AcrR family transcriptional regulator